MRGNEEIDKVVIETIVKELIEVRISELKIYVNKTVKKINAYKKMLEEKKILCDVKESDYCELFYRKDLIAISIFDLIDEIAKNTKERNAIRLGGIVIDILNDIFDKDEIIVSYGLSGNYDYALLDIRAGFCAYYIVGCKYYIGGKNDI